MSELYGKVNPDQKTVKYSQSCPGESYLKSAKLYYSDGALMGMAGKCSDNSLLNLGLYNEQDFPGFNKNLPEPIATYEQGSKSGFTGFDIYSGGGLLGGLNFSPKDSGKESPAFKHGSPVKNSFKCPGGYISGIEGSADENERFPVTMKFACAGSKPKTWIYVLVFIFLILIIIAIIAAVLIAKSRKKNKDESD